MANLGLIKCPSCEREISVNANPCPYCGEPNAGELGVEKVRNEIKYEIAAAEEWERGRPAREEAAREVQFKKIAGRVLIIILFIFGFFIFKSSLNDSRREAARKEAEKTKQEAEKITIFELTPDWNERNKMRLPAMKKAIFYCSEEGAEMAITYSAGNINVPSGQAFKCPTDENDDSIIGVGLSNAEFSFRSKKPGVTATVKIFKNR